MRFIHPVALSSMVCLGLLLAPASAFEVSFSNWGTIPLCTSGSPGTVPSPAFALRNVPEATKSLKFKLADLDVPGFDHGGGTVPVPKSATLAAGSFTYKSPCPPDGKHTYQWTVTALDSASRTLGTARAKKRYP